MAIRLLNLLIPARRISRRLSSTGSPSRLEVALRTSLPGRTAFESLEIIHLNYSAGINSGICAGTF